MILNNTYSCILRVFFTISFSLTESAKNRKVKRDESKFPTNIADTKSVETIKQKTSIMNVEAF